MNQETILRHKHIDSLRQYFPTVKEVKRDAVYEIPVQLPSGANITLRIFVDSRSNVTSEASSKLAQWVPTNSLGKMVYSIIQKFMIEPPRVVGKSQDAAPPPYPGSKSNKPLNSSINIPQIPSTFPELEKKKPAELGELLNDDEAFEKFFKSIPGVKTMTKLRDDLRADASDGELKQLNDEVAELQVLVQAKKAKYAELAKRQEAVMKKLSIDNLVEKLGEKASEVESDSDQLAVHFLDGEIDDKEFKRSFTTQRELYHLRSAKKESLNMKQSRNRQ